MCPVEPLAMVHQLSAVKENIKVKLVNQKKRERHTHTETEIEEAYRGIRKIISLFNYLFELKITVLNIEQV
jgi:hypothetical protein